MQWWLLIGIVATLGGLFQDVIKPIFISEESSEYYMNEHYKKTGSTLTQISDSLKTISDINSKLSSIDQKMNDLVIMKPSQAELQKEIAKNFVITDIQNIDIGITRDYARTILGSPRYVVSSNSFNLQDEFYVIDQVIIRLIFRHNTVQAYFVTINDQSLKGKIPVSIYGHIVDDKNLGDFNYYEIDFVPEEIQAYFQNGTGYQCYIEWYYYGSSSNHHTFVFANLIYGLWEAEYEFGEMTLDDELQKGYTTIDSNFDFDRKKSYPSTFGIIGYNVDHNAILDLILLWSEIDYHALNRNLENSKK